MTELARHDDTDARCLAFIILTVARAGAARQAKWKNIDLERGLWSVPIADLKTPKQQRRPSWLGCHDHGDRSHQNLAEARHLPVSRRSQPSDR